MVLLAVKLGMPDYVSTVIGGMLYFGFIMLPLGKVSTALVGGARTQAYFWLARNLAGLLIISAVFWTRLGWNAVAIGAVVVGAFLFYGFRAAGVVMIPPLIGDVSTEEERGKLISHNSLSFYGVAFFAMLVLFGVFHYNETVPVIAAVMVVGCLLGVIAASFLARMDETNALRDSAKKPVGAEIFAVLRDGAFLRFMIGCFSTNLAIIMLLPVAVLTIKKGLGASDAGALFCALWQFAAATAAGWIALKVSNKIGPRRTAISAFFLALATMTTWALFPMRGEFVMFAPMSFLCGLLFAAMGLFRTVAENSNQHYFLQTIPPERRIASTMVLNGVAGVAAGIIGIFLSKYLLGRLNATLDTTPTWTQLTVYRRYFLITLPLMLPGLIALLAVKPLPKERRWRSWVFSENYK